MKKLLMFSAAALALASPANAEEGTGDKPHRQGMLEKIDADKDGAISKAEFMAFHEQRFAEMDTNSDGIISKAEGEAKKAEWKAKRKEMHKGEAPPLPGGDAASPPAEAPPAEAPPQ